MGLLDVMIQALFYNQFVEREKKNTKKRREIRRKSNQNIKSHDPNKSINLIMNVSPVKTSRARDIKIQNALTYLRWRHG